MHPILQSIWHPVPQIYSILSIDTFATYHSIDFERRLALLISQLVVSQNKLSELFEKLAKIPTHYF